MRLGKTKVFSCFSSSIILARMIGVGNATLHINIMYTIVKILLRIKYLKQITNTKNTNKLTRITTTNYKQIII
jgi:mannitol/fructose-specific phosphotransferase system IIA component (Ntr-type)